jgi:hypothetical protein
MAVNLADFLSRLAHEPDLLESYRADKSGTMNEIGVSADHQAALLSGDPRQIHAALGAEHMENQQLDMDAFL